MNYQEILELLEKDARFKGLSDTFFRTLYSPKNWGLFFAMFKAVFAEFFLKKLQVI